MGSVVLSVSGGSVVERLGALVVLSVVVFSAVVCSVVDSVVLWVGS